MSSMLQAQIVVQNYYACVNICELFYVAYIVGALTPHPVEKRYYLCAYVVVVQSVWVELPLVPVSLPATAKAGTLPRYKNAH